MNTLKIANTEELLRLLAEVNKLLERVSKIEISAKELTLNVHFINQ